MVADAQTLSDLEILTARDGGPAVFDVMNRTRSRAGGRRLRAWFRRGLEGDELDAFQRAVRFFHESGFRPVLDAQLLLDVDAYLESNFDTLRSRRPWWQWVEGTWLAVRYLDLVRLARHGIGRTRALVSHVSALTRSLEERAVAGDAARITARLRRLLEGLGLDRHFAARLHTSILRADRAIRIDTRDRLREMIDLVAEIDALSACASLLDEGWVLPEREPDDGGLSLAGEGLWHPFLPTGVQNPVGLSGGETLVFLTGPNMAGKTTYLRAVGVCAYLAQCGLPVPARSFRVSRLDGLFTSLSPEDNLRAGVSYFLAEVKRVREVLEHVTSGRRTLAIFDEVFRGTNVRDAFEASRAVILGCSNARRSGFLFSSHLAELADDLKDVPSVRFFCFDGRLSDAGATFDYALKPGVSEQRFGMELLRREGVDVLLERLTA